MTKSEAKKGTPSATKRSIPIIGLVFAVVALILVLTVLFGTGGEAPEPETQYGTPEVSGQLPPFTDTASDSAIGQAAPEVIGENFQDEEVRIVNDGRAKAIVFLAHWCPHCQAEVPEVQQWINETGGIEGVDMYSVATSTDPLRTNYPPQAWLEDEEWTAPVVRDDETFSVLRAYGGSAFPFWAFVNADGTIALRVAGSVGISNLEQILTALDAS